MRADEKRARELVTARSGGVCECCGMQRATEWQHRVRRSQLGLWSAANGLHVDHTCHSWITHHPDAAGALGWHLRSWEDPLTAPVKLFARGWVLLKLDGSVEPTSPPEDDTDRRTAA